MTTSVPDGPGRGHLPDRERGGGSWQSPTIGGGHVGDQNILRFAAYDSTGNYDPGTHDTHSLWGYQSTDSGNNNQFNTCASLNVLAKTFCIALHALPLPGGFWAMDPGINGGQGPGDIGGGGGSDAGAPDAPIYHRLESPTWPPEVAAQQVASGEIWGKVTVWGDEPIVEAYYGPLPPDAKGIEFTADVPPSSTGHPGNAYWYGSQKGVTISGDYAKVPVTILRSTQ